MPGKVDVYKADGERVEMYAIDAREAVMKHPDEWSYHAPKGAKKDSKSGDPALVESSEFITERAGPTRRDGPETSEAQRDPHAVGKPAPVNDPAAELGEDPDAADDDDDETAAPARARPAAKSTADKAKKAELIKEYKALTGNNNGQFLSVEKLEAAIAEEKKNSSAGGGAQSGSGNA